MSGSDDYSFSEIDLESDLESLNPEVVNNITEAENKSEDIQSVYSDYKDYRPYYCGCVPDRKFKQRDSFRYHMSKNHNVVIPNKFNKRKAEEVQDDSTMKEYKK